MKAFFGFIWRWLLPSFGLMYTLILFGMIFLPPFDFLSGNESEPLRAKPDEVWLSPDESKKLVFAGFAQLDVGEMFDVLLSGVSTPYADGFIYVTSRDDEVTWVDDLSSAHFTEKYVDGRNDERFIRGRWEPNWRAILEYCGVEIGGVSNAEWVDGDIVELEIHRASDCPDDIKIGKEELEDWFE